jgi:hypothetical protein
MNQFEKSAASEKLEPSKEQREEEAVLAARELVRILEERLEIAKNQRATELSNLEGCALSPENREDIITKVNKFWDDLFKRREESIIEARENLKKLEEQVG